MGIPLSHFHWEYYGNGEGIGVAFQLYVKSVYFPFPSVGCSVFHVGGDSFLKRERFTSGIYRVVRKNIAQTLTHCHQWRRQGMRGGVEREEKGSCAPTKIL